MKKSSPFNNLNEVLWRIRTVVPALLCATVCFAVGLLFFDVSISPGNESYIVTWLGNSSVSFGIGLFLCVGGLGFFVRTLLVFRKRGVFFNSGALSCLVEESLFRQTVQRLWSEFFGRKDLGVDVRCTRKGLSIEGDAPSDRRDFDLLSEHLCKKLFAFTGYWGPIKIVLRAVSPQKD